MKRRQILSANLTEEFEVETKGGILEMKRKVSVALTSTPATLLSVSPDTNCRTRAQTILCVLPPG